MVCFAWNIAYNTICYILFCWKDYNQKHIVIGLKLRAKLSVCGFLSALGTFSHKMVQTWFVWHQTGHTILIGTYYGVEFVRNQNNSQMFEITCYVACLWFFKRFCHFLAQSGSNFVCFAWKVVLKTIWYILLCWNLLELNTIVTCFKLRSKLRF